MTKPQTIDDRLERIAAAEERQATALEGILEALLNFKFESVGPAGIAVAGVETEAEEPVDAVDETPAPEETTAEEPAGDEPVEETGEADEAPAEAEAAAEDEGDPLGDGDATVEATTIEIPEKLSADHVRNVARNVLSKHGKPAVFEVLAKIGDGYKAVGEVSSDDLEDAFVKMSEKLAEDPPH